MQNIPLFNVARRWRSGDGGSSPLSLFVRALDDMGWKSKCSKRINTRQHHIQIHGICSPCCRAAALHHIFLFYIENLCKLYSISVREAKEYYFSMALTSDSIWFLLRFASSCCYSSIGAQNIPNSPKWTLRSVVGTQTQSELLISAPIRNSTDKNSSSLPLAGVVIMWVAPWNSTLFIYRMKTNNNVRDSHQLLALSFDVRMMEDNKTEMTSWHVTNIRH